MGQATDTSSSTTRPFGELAEAMAAPSVASARWLNGGIARLDPQGCLADASDALLYWLDTDLTAVRGRDFAALVGQRFPEWEAALRRLLEGAPTFDQVELASADAHAPQRFSVETFCHQGVRFVRLQSVLPPLKELEESGLSDDAWREGPAREVYLRLLRAETQLDNLIHRWPGVVFSQRPDFSFSFVSPRIEEMTGVTASDWRRSTRYFWEVVHEADVESLQQRLQQAAGARTGLTSTYRIRHIETGRVSYVWEHRQATRSANGLLLGFEGLWLDISRQTIAEKRLSAMAWKENFGVLTMGLAHDLSNIMAGILSLSETFQADLSADHPFQEGLALIKRNATQASQMVRRVRQLHEGKSGERSYHDLNELVTDMAELMRKTVPRRILVQTVLAPGQLPVYLDAVEFRQAIINLAINAVDAMPHGGQVFFRTSRHEQHPPLTNVQGRLPRLPCVCLAVQDTGTGIPACYLGSIFDPFFTTKSVGKGSGLGLYNARLFAEKHHGAIAVASQEKAGATFSLWLPQADFTEGLQSAAQPSPPRHALLVVGGTPPSWDSLVACLREHGFYAVAAASETDAAELLHSPEYQFTGVIVQAMLGDHGSLGLLDQIRKERLPVKTILNVAGCHMDEIDTKLLKAVDRVIAQDLALPEFLAQLRAALDDAGH